MQHIITIIVKFFKVVGNETYHYRMIIFFEIVNSAFNFYPGISRNRHKLVLISKCTGPREIT